MGTESNLVVRDHRAIASEDPPPYLPTVINQETVLLEVIAKAASSGSQIDLERMERLLVMHERLQAKRAEQDFIDAMARFKANAPTITKDKRVYFTSSKGTTDYMHATLGNVCQVAIAGLAAVGISHRWDLDQGQGGMITVTCVLTHVGGHSIRTPLSGNRDDTGNKNNLQQVASTITYLERYTLLAATGLATDDDDGRAAGGKQQAPQKVAEIQKPDTFDNWWANAEAAADDSSRALQECFKNAPEGCRVYMNRVMPDDWQALKAKAVKADLATANGGVTQ